VPTKGSTTRSPSFTAAIFDMIIDSKGSIDVLPKQNNQLYIGRVMTIESIEIQSVIYHQINDKWNTISYI